MTQPASGAGLGPAGIRLDNLLEEDPQLGLIAFSSPFDPAPSLVVRDGRVVELDGRPEAEFDVIDEFLARHGIDVDVAPEAMALDDIAFARLLIDTTTPRAEVTRLARGMTPAKHARVLALLRPVEILQAMQKMRLRRTPSIQGHVTNRLDHPLLLAADSASAVARGFRELETTVPVLRDAPLNAVALLIGGQVGAPGALCQCSVEERAELELGLRGLTTYAETVSLYGTEPVFVDGDDTPWSKALLVSAYASRGLKMRVTSGSGAEVLMGAAERKSMLYLEARCVMLARAAGAQGVQNGGIDGVNVTATVPDGMREVIAENLLVMMLGLESCTGNDTKMSSSDLRRTAHTLPILLAGSDFLFSGFGTIPSYDNQFGPSNFNAEDLDDYLVIQRDWGFEGGLRYRTAEELEPLRRRAAEACRAALEELDLISFTDAEVDAVVGATGSLDVPEPPREAVAAAGDAVLSRGITALDVVRALVARGFDEEAERITEMLRQRLLGDYLQPSAIFDERMRVLSAITDPNDYAGPGTGYRLSARRRAEIARVANVRTAAASKPDRAGGSALRELHPAEPGTAADEVVIGISPAFAMSLHTALNGEPVEVVLRAVVQGIRDGGGTPRIARIVETIDVGAIGARASELAGSGIGVGLQAKGTAVVHRRGDPPLANLELFPIAPRVSLEMYRALGENAARYARAEAPPPILTPESNDAIGPRYHASVVAMVAAERAAVEADVAYEIEVPA